MAKRIYTQSELEILLVDVQKWLRLEDWDIAVQLVNQSAIFQQMGSIDMFAYFKQATIVLPTPETYASNVRPEQDMLQSLIHELLHIHGRSFFPQDLNAQEHVECEFMLNAVADALTDAYDGTKRKELPDGIRDHREGSTDH